MSTAATMMQQPPMSSSLDPGPGVLFPEATYALQGIENDLQLDEVWNEGLFDPDWFDLQPDAYYASGNNSCGFIPNAPIVDEVDKSDFRQSTETAFGTPMTTSGVRTIAGTRSVSSDDLHECIY